MHLTLSTPIIFWQSKLYMSKIHTLFYNNTKESMFLCIEIFNKDFIRAPIKKPKTN